MIATPDLAGLTIIHQAGSGSAVTHAGVYPLGEMAFTHAPNGRGSIILKAGMGALQLSGSKADHLGPGHWRLHIDRTALISISPAKGACEMRTSASPSTPASLKCRVRIGNDRFPITVDWRGDDSAALRVR